MYVKVIWTLAVAYGLVGLGLFYSLAVDSSELFLAIFLEPLQSRRGRNC